MQHADIDEIRRNAPLHYEARAAAARYAAWVLFQGYMSDSPPDGREIGFGGWDVQALREAWTRERSFALESIIKAALAAKHEGAEPPVRMPMTHNVRKLWDMAGLPAVDDDDNYRLLRTWQLLQWAGRYAAPAKGSDGQRNDVWSSMRGEPGMPALLVQPEFEWAEFDSLYQRAYDGFLAERARRQENFGSFD